MTDSSTSLHPAPSRSRAYPYYSSPAWKRFLLTREFAVVIALIIVAVGASTSIRKFSSPLTLGYLLLDATPILLIALPMTLILISAEIDLSVASIVGLSNVTLGALFDAGWPVELAALAALVLGILCGAINGLLVTVVGLPSLAVTIGTLALFRGIAVGILGTKSVVNFPEYWTTLTTSIFGKSGIPYVIVLVVILALAFVLLLHFTPFGRGIFAIGRNQEVAAFSGVKVQRTKFILFVLSGLVSALAGIYFTFRYGSARGDNAQGLELTVIAAVLLGGVSIFGGKGALHGVLAGVLLIGTLQSALRFVNVTSDVINIVVGALLVASIVSPSFFAWLKGKIPRAAKERASKAPANRG